MASVVRHSAIGEQKSDILKRMARDAPVAEVLDAICHAIEALVPGARASILRRSRNGRRLHGCVAPGMPPAYLAVVEGIEVGPASGSCGMAAYTGNRVIARDVSTDPHWADALQVARDFDIGACWSEPVIGLGGEVMGTFALYRREPGEPDDREIDIVAEFADLASVALQKEVRRAERLETERQLASLMENIPGVVLQWAVPPGGRPEIRFASESVVEMTGLAADTIIRDPRSLLRRIPGDERAPLVRKLRESATNLTPVRLDFSIRQNDGGRKWVRLVSRPRTDSLGGVISDALGLDITDRHETEARLQDSRAELNDRVIELHRTKARLEAQSATLMEAARELTIARDMAEEASRAKSEFLSNMTHELRTPLNAIIGFSEIIKDQTFGPVGSPKYRTYAHDINDAGRHLLELINEILHFAKLESGKDRLLEDEFPIAEAVDAVVRMVRDSADRAGVAVTATIPADAPSIRADKRKIRQILINLLSNAIKFTGRGGKVTLNVWSRAESGLVLQVIDTGIGIELADIPKALGAFGQIDSAFSRSHDGTGLGLPLTKALCEMHGGSLDLQSQIGVGTTVTVRLPAERIVPSIAQSQPVDAGAATRTAS